MGRMTKQQKAERDALGYVCVHNLVRNAILKAKACNRSRREHAIKKATNSIAYQKQLARNRENARKRRETDPIGEAAKASTYHLANREKHLASYKARYEVNRQHYIDRAAVRLAAFTPAQKEHHNAQVRRRHHERVAEDPEYHMRIKLRCRVRNAMNRGDKGGSTFGADGLVGCTSAEFVAHIKTQLVGAMTLDTVQIDHIWPLAMYDLTDVEQQRKAFNWRNCRPAWPKDNLEKADRKPTPELAAMVSMELWPPEH